MTAKKTTSFRNSILLGSLILLILALSGLKPAEAAVITVTNLNDSGAGSLRDAINSAVSGDAIEFGTLSGEIKLLSKLQIYSSITIRGNSDIKIDGSSTPQNLIEIKNGFVELSNLTIQNAASTSSWGGALDIGDATVIIRNVIFDSNQAPSGGALYVSGFNTKVDIVNSTFSNNRITGPQGAGGGMYLDTGATVTISNSTVSHNSAFYGGGIFHRASRLTVSGSTFSDNSAHSFVSSLGGGAIHTQQRLLIQNSTFSNNSSGRNGGGIYSTTDFGLQNSTFNNNTAIDEGGGIYFEDSAAGSRVINTIIANSNQASDCGGAVISPRHSFDTDGSCGATQKTTEQLNLGPLEDNDCATKHAVPTSVHSSGEACVQTHALQSNSAAIDAGDVDTCIGQEGGINYVDQRGVVRVGATAPCDIGAYESGVFSTAIPRAILGPISGNTSEAGASATFDIKLSSQPTVDVTIPIVTDTTEGVASPTSVTFTTANWHIPQTVTITGVDDDIDDGNMEYVIQNGETSSSDSNYQIWFDNFISVANTNDDTKGFAISEISGNTSEAGGTVTFTVKLTSQPTADVTVPISSTDTTEGTVAPSSLTFTEVNWNTAQTVTVTGVDDDIDDENINYSIALGEASSLDSKYQDVDPDDVAVVNEDDDTKGITVSAISGNTLEAGGTATFTVKLTSQPTASVTVPISSTDTTEGTVSPSPLTFTEANWNTAQTVTVTGVDDDIDDANINYSIELGLTLSLDSNYQGVDPDDVAVVNEDDDAIVSINHSMGAPGSGFVITGLRYPANSAVEIVLTWPNGQQTVVSTTMTDSNGAFSHNLQTNEVSPEGDFTLSARSGSGNNPVTSNTNFTLSSLAPMRTIPASAADNPAVSIVYPYVYFFPLIFK